MPIDRRVFLVGAPVAVLGAAAGTLAYRNWTTGVSTVDIGGDYEKYLADVAGDYRAGNVDVIDGWVLSATEARTYRDMLSD
jgi:hypothetical protein